MNPLALIESRMSLHMLIEFPALLLLGWALGRRWVWGGFARIDALGLLGATLASCVFAFWMIPAALDWALLSPAVAAAKYLSWIGAGAMLAWGRERLSPVVGAFFLGNAAWMLATAGLLYRDTESQLCVNYLINDQWLTGAGLLTLSFVLGGLALMRLKPLL